MVKHGLTLLTLGLITIAQIRAQCLSPADNSGVVNKDAKKLLYKGEQIFTAHFLRALNEVTPNENVFFSPYSLYHALLLAYFGSRNTTEKELKQALNLQWTDNKLDVMRAYNFQKRSRQLKDESLEFSSADRLYFSSSVQLKDCMTDFFESELQVLDFVQKPEESRAQINSWVEEITKGMIKNLLTPGAITAQTNVVLANAAYFKGKWSTKFDEAMTQKKIFYIDAERKTFVPMMFVNGHFNLAVNEELGCHILELPYNSSTANSISMMVFLPSGQKNLLEHTLSKITPETLKAALQEGSSGLREVDVRLPKFTVEKVIELVPVLSKLGLADLFTPSADLGAFSENTKLSFDDGVHKAKIEVDENGSTAAAATSLFSFRSARPLDPAQFNCDHPFMYMIYDKVQNVILFAGIYRGPE